MIRRDGAAGGLRAGLLLLVVLGVAGTALALAYERHWLGAWQLAPWITLGIISVAVVALVVRQTTATVFLARAVAVLAIVSAAVGVWQHIDANLNPHADHDHHAHDAADDADEEAMASDDHHHAADDADEEAPASDDHHAAADDADEEAMASDDHHHAADDADEEAPASDDHHAAADDADEEAMASDDHHHAADDADEEATERADDHADDHADAEEATAAGPSLGDVLAGSAGHAPVPAALAIAPVGLALGLATIGLGGRKRSQG